MTVGRLETKILLQPSVTSNNNNNSTTQTNSNLRKTMPLNPKRCLFGPPNPDETKKMFQDFERENRRQMIERFGMDPITEREADFSTYEEAMKLKNSTADEQTFLEKFNREKNSRIKERIGIIYFKDLLDAKTKLELPVKEKDAKTTASATTTILTTTLATTTALTSPKEKVACNKNVRHSPYDKSRDSKKETNVMEAKQPLTENEDNEKL